MSYILRDTRLLLLDVALRCAAAMPRDELCTQPLPPWEMGADAPFCKELAFCEAVLRYGVYTPAGLPDSYALKRYLRLEGSSAALLITSAGPLGVRARQEARPGDSSLHAYACAAASEEG